MTGLDVIQSHYHSGMEMLRMVVETMAERPEGTYTDALCGVYRYFEMLEKELIELMDGMA